MSFEQARAVRQKLTDKFVVVASGVPELRRFAGLTGTVKTVNMSGRALVQFDGPVDIGWYDIHPDYLQVVDAPLPKVVKTDEKSKAKAAAKPAGSPAAAPAAKPEPATQPAPAPVGAKKLSPLEIARAQGAAKAAAAGGGAPAAAPVAAPAAEGKKLSPLELARQQGAKKAEAAAAAPAEAAAPATPPPAAPAPKAPAATTGPDGRKLSPLELARQQGAAKKP